MNDIFLYFGLPIAFAFLALIGVAMHERSGRGLQQRLDAEAEYKRQAFQRNNE